MLVPALHRPVSLIGLIWILSPRQTSAGGVGVHIRGGRDDKSLTFGAAKIPHHERETLGCMKAEVMPTCTNKTGLWKKKGTASKVIGTCVDGAEGEPNRRGFALANAKERNYQAKWGENRNEKAEESTKCDLCTHPSLNRSGRRRTRSTGGNAG